MPDEILLHIFQFLDLDAVLACERVSRRWRKVALDAGVWRRTVVVCSAQHGQVCPATLKIIRSHRMVLRHLKMQYILKYSSVSSLSGICKNLSALEMVMCRIQVELEEDLKRWPKLKKLNLKNSLLKSTRPILLPLGYFKELTFLCLSDFGLTTENCDALLQCSQLNHILIDQIKGLEISNIRKLISTKQQTIITIHLYGGESIDDDCVLMLAQCPKLKDLNILHCEALTDRALDGIANLKCILRLQIWHNTSFSEAKLMKTFETERLRQLRRLSLSRVRNVTGNVVDIISEYYTNLMFLALYLCPRINKSHCENQLKAKFRNIEIVLY